MRQVLQLIDTTGPGGAETIFIELCTRMQGRGWRVLPVIVGPGWVHESLVAEGVDPVVIPTTRRMDVRFLRKLVAVARRRSAVLVHGHLVSPAFYATLAGRALGVPAVGTLHGLPDVDARGIRGRLRLRIVGRAASAVVAVSDSLRRAALRNGLPAGRVTVIPNGIALDDFQADPGRSFRGEIGAGAHHFLVGALGNVRPLKDYPTFIRAAGMLAQRSADYRFVLAGEASEDGRRELEDLARDVGISDRITFAGFRSDVARVLSGLDALVVSSRSEGFSLATVQALATGTPVVATRCGGPEEILEDGTDGILVPAGDAGAIAGAVERLRREPSEAERLVTNGIRKTTRRFGLDAMLDAYDRLYRRVLGLPLEVERSLSTFR